MHPKATASEKDFDNLVLRMRTAARGPQAHMTVVMGGMKVDGSVHLQIVVNTNEPASVLEARMRKAIGIEDMPGQTVLTIEEMKPVQAVLFWNQLRGAAAATVEQEQNRS
jgi:hypothetical protein